MQTLTPRLAAEAAALLLALIPACAPSAPRPEQPTPVPTVVAPTVTAPTASAAPIPSATPDARPKEVPLLPTPFHVIAEDRWLRMHSSGEHLLVMGSELQAELEGDTLVRSARLGRGLPKQPYSVDRIAGDFPEPLVIRLFDGRPDAREKITSYLYRKTGWQRVDKSPLPDLACAWHGPEGQVAIFTGASFERWSGPPRAKLPRMPPSANAEPRNPLAFSSPKDQRCTPDGHVFAVAEGPDQEAEPLRLAIWKPDGELPSMTPVPIVPRCDRNASCHVQGAWLDAKGPRDVWLLGTAPTDPRHGDKPFLTHFDGTSWTQLEVPPADDAWSSELVDWKSLFAVGDDGTAWIVRGVRGVGDRPGYWHELWRRSPDGTWARLAMPSMPDTRDEMEPGAVLVRGKDDVWVVASSYRSPVRWFILRTRPQPVVTSTSPALEVKP